MNLLLRIILRVLLSPFLLLGFMIPTNKNIWIFGSWRGEKYSDNSKYLYEYIVENKKDIRPIWLTKEEKVLTQLISQGREVHYFYSLRGIFYSLIGKVLIMSASWIDLPLTSFIAKRKLKVQLWHGTPMRKLNLKNGSFIQKLFRNVFIAYIGKEYDLVCTAAEKNVEILSLVDRFNVSRDTIKVTGQPRNDVLFNIEKNKQFLKKRKNEKIFLYLPTWRNYDFNIFSKKYMFDYQRINKFLEDNKSYLVVKVHHNEFLKYKKFMKNFSKSGSKILMSFADDIYPYLNNTDALLTDYSSIYFDYLLLEKPVLFLSFDFEDYVKDNSGFYYNFNKITAGPKLKNWDQVLEEMKKIINTEDSYRLTRKKIRDQFNRYKDNRSSERVFKSITMMNDNLHE
jgi:CDP-glycerol glycerophosphotransferase (TagB/SpsB family)